MPIDLSRRNLQPELMDEPGLDPAQHAQALAGLRRINWFSRTVSSVWRPIERIARQRGLKPVRVLDLACGGGDLVAGLSNMAKRRGVDAVIDGADISPTAVELASRNAVNGSSFRVLDALAGDLPDDYDVITCTLFLHHLQRDQVVGLLGRAAAAARHAVVADDLIRSRLGYGLAWFGCHLLTRSPIVHFDGPVSVEGAFSFDEARAIVDDAGLAGARIDRHWPERFQVVWERET